MKSKILLSAILLYSGGFALTQSPDSTDIGLLQIELSQGRIEHQQIDLKPFRFVGSENRNYLPRRTNRVLINYNVNNKWWLGLSFRSLNYKYQDPLSSAYELQDTGLTFHSGTGTQTLTYAMSEFGISAERLIWHKKRHTVSVLGNLSYVRTHYMEFDGFLRDANDSLVYLHFHRSDTPLNRINNIVTGLGLKYRLHMNDWLYLTAYMAGRTQVLPFAINSSVRSSDNSVLTSWVMSLGIGIKLFEYRRMVLREPWRLGW